MYYNISTLLRLNFSYICMHPYDWPDLFLLLTALNVFLTSAAVAAGSKKPKKVWTIAILYIHALV